ncbi:MAG: hypothetical protein ACR2HQ_05845 [Ilumatobacteraceae bacterium]
MARLSDPVPALTGDDRRTYERMRARRERHGVGLYGPYVPLLHHPQLADRIERLGGYLKFDGILPRDRYQFVVLAFAHEVGADFERRDHVRHAVHAGVPQDVIDAIGAAVRSPRHTPTSPPPSARRSPTATCLRTCRIASSPTSERRASWR